LMAPGSYRTKKIRQRRSRVKTVEKRWTHDRQCVPSLTCGLTQHVALPVVVLTACFACVILTWPWDQWKFPKFEVAWLVVDLLAYHGFFAECLPWPCVNRLQLCLTWSVLYSFMVHPLFSFSDYPSDTSYPPLTGKGRWCCDFARAGFRQNLGEPPSSSKMIINPSSSRYLYTQHVWIPITGWVIIPHFYNLKWPGTRFEFVFSLR
jgi:hypothetical protein